MSSFLMQYITDHFTKILSWSPESKNILKISDAVDWSVGVPNCSTFRINTLVRTVEEGRSYIEQALVKRFESENKQPPPVRIHEVISDCVVIGKLNESQLDLTPKPNEVIVDALCGAAVLRGSNVFAAGVKGMLPHTNVGSEVSVYADISSKCLKGYKRMYEDEGKFFVGNGIALMNRHKLFDGGQQPKGVAVNMNNPLSGLVMIEYPKDLGILQNLPSMICVWALDPKSGDTVLDMCAAPGNKTTHIGTLMKDEGILVAIDRKTKVNFITANCSYMKISKCIHVFPGDSRNIVGASDRPVTAGPPFAPQSFDKILLDAACSCLGIRPMLVNFVISESRLRSFSNVQKQFIDNAIPLLKPGGTLVYSTCSILCEENECIVAWTLQKYPEMELVPANPIVGGPGFPECGLNEDERHFVQRFGPGVDTRDTIGFFIAKFKKN